MAASLDPPPDEPSSRGAESASGNPPRGRRLRARRPGPPLRLIEQGDGGAAPAGLARLDLTAATPLAFMRLGRHDLEAGMRAVGDRLKPTAVITGLAESRETIVRVRHLTRETEVPWLADPLLFRTGLEGYRTAPTLQALDYTPGRDGDPYLPAEFDDADLSRRVGRSVVGAQVDLLATGAISGAFTVSRIDDPWLAVNQTLLRIGADAAAAWSVPLVAALPIRMSGFDELEAQRLLVRALAARRPDAWLLMADGLVEDSGVERIVATLRFALLLQAASAPVILARAGDLRRLAWSLGVAGAEFGLGRLLRFAVPDFRKAKRGPGPTPGPRMEFPSLACSLPFEQARRLLAGDLVAEAECTCPSCADAASLAARMASVAEHDAHMVLREAAALAAQRPDERVADFDRVLQAATGRAGWVDSDASADGVRARLGRQRRVLDAATEAGLLEPARLAAELRLFD